MIKRKVLTVSEFADLLDNYKYQRFAGLQTITVPTLNKKDRRSGLSWSAVFPNVEAANVRKIANGCATVGPDYVSAIVNRLAKEGKDAGEYKSGTTWHVAVPGTKCLRAHKTSGDLYAYFGFLSKVKRGGEWVPLKMKVRYVDITTGKELDKDLLAGFLPVDKPPQNQGLDEDNAVIVRTYKLESVRQLVLGGVVYTIATK